MSKVVAALHVCMVATPDNVGVHWKTCSGALSIREQVPVCVLGPLVVPLNVPPAAGMTIGFAHAFGVAVTVGTGTVVAVAVGVRNGVAVAVGVANAVSVTVGVAVSVTVGVAVTLGVGVGFPGDKTKRSNAPRAPLKPSMTMKYVLPATTVGVMTEPWPGPLAVAEPGVSSLHATSVPAAQFLSRR